MSEEKEPTGGTQDGHTPQRETVELGEALRKSTDLFPQASTGGDDAPPSMLASPEPPPEPGPTPNEPPQEPPADK